MKEKIDSLKKLEDFSHMQNLVFLAFWKYRTSKHSFSLTLKSYEDFQVEQSNSRILLAPILDIMISDGNTPVMDPIELSVGFELQIRCIQKGTSSIAKKTSYTICNI